VAGSILRRLTLLLSALAFVLATALPNAVSARAMPASMPCGHCPDKAPAGSGKTGGDLGKMVCGALACAGVAVGLPARQAPYLPAFAKLDRAPDFVPAIIGITPIPEPYPPRPIVLG
jgi:hypothetical protein